MKRYGFTLSEVLITLGIIGVIAALTIPTVLQNAQEKATITALKKTYSTLTSAYNLAVQENGTPDNWNLTDNRSMVEKLIPYLSISKNCIDGSKGCWPTGITYKRLDNVSYLVVDDMARPKVILADGTLLVGSNYANCGANNTWGTSLPMQNLCGEYYVDINGFKSPNQWGKDLFLFNLSTYGILPVGTPQYINAFGYAFSSCSTASTGFGCAGWVLNNENQEYLKCTGLSWAGATKCP